MSASVFIVLFSLAQTIQDPVADYIQNPLKFEYFEHDVEEIQVLRADMDGDGNDDVLVRSPGDYENRQGYNWAVYIKESTGYSRSAQGTLISGWYHVGASERIEGKWDTIPATKYGILSLATGGSNLAGVIWVRVEDGVLKRTNIGDIDAAGGELELANNLFNENVEEAERIKVAGYRGPQQSTPPTPASGSAPTEDDVATADSPSQPSAEAPAEPPAPREVEANDVSGESESESATAPKNPLAILVGVFAFLAIAIFAFRRFHNRGR